MITSFYAECIKNKDLPQERFFELINSMQPEMFLPLLDEFSGYAKSVMLYTLYAYSSESPMLLLASSWENTKERIAEYIQLPDDVHGAVLRLMSDSYRGVVRKYLNSQADRDFVHLAMNQEFYNTVLQEMLQGLRTEEGKVDIDGLSNKRKMLKDLLEEIYELESQLRQRHAYVYEGIEDVQKVDDIKKSDGKSKPGIANSRFVS